MMYLWIRLFCMIGGTQLALKGGSSAGIGMTELIGIVEAFELQNSVRIELRATLTIWKGSRDLQWVASAFSRTVEGTGVLPLAYASVRCGEQRLVTMEAVVLRLLYALDFQLAQRELAGDTPKS